MRVAVTGASGLLGGAVARHATERGYEIIRLSHTSPTPGADVRIWCADQDLRETASALAGAEAVIHCAAHIPKDKLDPRAARPCLEVNALGTLNLLRACEHLSIQRFIFVSGANILRLRAGSVREAEPIDCRLAPYYLGSKVIAEIYVRSFCPDKLSCLVIRPTSIYGPGMTTGVLSTLVQNLRSRKPVTLFDGGRFQADFVWRDDVAAMAVKALESQRTGVVNLGSGSAVSLLHVASTIADILDVDRALINVEPATGRSAIRGFSAVDNARAQRWFGYQPRSLEHGLKLWLNAGG